MQQVFINLVTNAADAIQGGGEITFSTYLETGTEQQAPQVTVAIKDTGEGISAEDIQHIFDPFFTRKAEGTGLGLAICQQILQSHSATIDVESTVGKGTTFWIRIPVQS